jgi:hypothetical protein
MEVLYGCMSKSQRGFTASAAQMVASLSVSSLTSRLRYALQVPNVHSHRQTTRFWLSSTTTGTVTSASSDISSKLRSMIKPFLLKCHPDVHVAASCKKINMTAVQNLNAYLDTIRSISNGKYKLERGTSTSSDGSERIVEVDFVILVDSKRGKGKKKGDGKEQVVCRRKVELALPPQQLCINLAAGINASALSTNTDQGRIAHQLQQRLMQHTSHEVVKLLSIAGLSNEVMEKTTSHDIHDVIVDDIIGGRAGYRTGYEPYQDQSTSSTEANDLNVFRRAHHVRAPTKRDVPKTQYEAARDKYTASIPWHNYQKLYDEAVAEMNADYATRGYVPLLYR